MAVYLFRDEHTAALAAVEEARDWRRRTGEITPHVVGSDDADPPTLWGVWPQLQGGKMARDAGLGARYVVVVDICKQPEEAP